MTFRRFLVRGGGIFVFITFLFLFLIAFYFSRFHYLLINGVMYRVTLADTPISREHGLMFTPKLPHSEGMLFVFDRPDFHVFWMKNTYIPLDMVWMDCEYRVVDIYRNAQPNSEELIIPTVNSLYVLEVNAGDSDRHRVLPGMQATVDGPLFGLYYFFQEYLNGFFGLEKLLINHF